MLDVFREEPGRLVVHLHYAQPHEPVGDCLLHRQRCRGRVSGPSDWATHRSGLGLWLHSRGRGSLRGVLSSTLLWSCRVPTPAWLGPGSEVVGFGRDPGRLRGGSPRSLSPRAGALQPSFVDLVFHEADRIRAGGRLLILLTGVEGAVFGRPWCLGVLNHSTDRQAEQTVELGFSIHNPGLVTTPSRLVNGLGRPLACGVVFGQRGHVTDGPDVVRTATAVRPCEHTPAAGRTSGGRSS